MNLKSFMSGLCNTRHHLPRHRFLDFLCPLKVALEVLHDRVLGSLGRQLLMTQSTQEPNTMAPQSALCICWGKWKAKLIVPIYFGTKTSTFCLRIIFFLSLESEFRLERLQSKLRSSTFDKCEITAWRFDSNLQYFKRRLPGEWNGKLDTEWRSRETKSRTALSMVNSLRKHKVPTRV